MREENIAITKVLRVTFVCLFQVPIMGRPPRDEAKHFFLEKFQYAYFERKYDSIIDSFPLERF